MKKKLLGLIAGLMVIGVMSLEAKEKCLVMGLIPVEDPKAVIEQYTPLKNWLEKELGMCIKMITATDYAGIIEAMRAKKVDFAWFGPFSYVLANQRAGAEAFAVGILERGGHTYRSYLVATPEVAQQLGIFSPLEGESGMKVLAEKFKNHKKKFTFSFTDVSSTSGYAVPRYFMHKAGIDPAETFKDVGFLGTHDAVELAVKNKVVDIVADNDLTYPRMLEEGRISTESNVVIWKSPPIPGSPIALRKDLPENIKSALKKAIVRVPKNLFTAGGFGKITGYQIVTDEDYIIIKDIKKVIDSLR